MRGGAGESWRKEERRKKDGSRSRCLRRLGGRSDSGNITVRLQQVVDPFDFESFEGFWSMLLIRSLELQETFFNRKSLVESLSIDDNTPSLLGLLHAWFQMSMVSLERTLDIIGPCGEV